MPYEQVGCLQNQHDNFFQLIINLIDTNINTQRAYSSPLVTHHRHCLIMVNYVEIIDGYNINVSVYLTAKRLS